MKRSKSIVLFVAGICLLHGTIIKGNGLNEIRQSVNKSPYFYVKGDPEVDSFPLLKTKAEVHIAGFVTEVNLTQVYKNSGSKTLEAVYIFPVSTHSAVHGMRIKIGERIIDAEIKEKKEAEQIYTKAIQEGKTASLLQQQRPNVFQMNVGNILPGDIIEVTLTYTEILVPEKGTYEFVLPTVVGPRFTGEKVPEELEGIEEWTMTPYLHEGKNPSYTLNIDISLRTGIPLSNISVPSHKANIQHLLQDRAKITLSDQEKYGGNRDFILKYCLDGNAIHTGVLLYPGKEENYFLLMVKPPESVSMQIVPPREYIFIVDVSGSMHGFPLQVSKELIRTIISGLRKEDFFNIIFFAGGSKALSPVSLKGTAENKEKALAMLNAQNGTGGTRILDALQRAYSLKKTKGISRIIVAATDGYVNVEKKAFDIIRKNFGNSNFFAFGIGKSVNRYLIEGMAHAGKGEPFVVTGKSEAAKTAEKFADYIEAPLLVDTDVLYEGMYAYDMHPACLPDLFADRPLVILGKYKNPEGSITVSGITPMGLYTKKFNICPMNAHESNSAIQYLWARKKIGSLSDYTQAAEDIQKEVTALGLTYNCMTQFTSFVAVDKIIRNNGEIVTVKQPLPLPQGVSDCAVGCSRCIRTVELKGEGWVGVFGVG